MNTTPIDTILDNMIACAKDKRWHSATYNINTDKGVFALGVKSYGKWVQRVQLCEYTDEVPEQRTYKALREEFIALVNRMVASL
jgi:hypothetical protein